MENFNELNMRIAALEQHNKKLQRWLSVIILSAILAAVGGWTARERILSVDKIETNELTITDSKGKARIRMQTSQADDLALIRIFGADTTFGSVSIGNSINHAASSIAFTDSKGRRRMSLNMENDSNVLLNVYNSMGKVTAALISRGPTSALYSGASVIIDSAGQSRIMSGCTAEEKYEPFLYFFDKSGKQRIAANVREDGVGLLKFNDENEKAASAIGVQPKSRGFVVVLDTAGKSKWGSPP